MSFIDYLSSSPFLLGLLRLLSFFSSTFAPSSPLRALDFPSWPLPVSLSCSLTFFPANKSLPVSVVLSLLYGCLFLVVFLLFSDSFSFFSGASLSLCLCRLHKVHQPRVRSSRGHGARARGGGPPQSFLLLLLLREEEEKEKDTDGIATPVVVVVVVLFFLLRSLQVREEEQQEEEEALAVVIWSEGVKRGGGV